MLRAALRRLPSWRERVLLANERRSVLALISPGSICAEIGVWQGDFAAQILETCRPIKLHLIDPWPHAVIRAKLLRKVRRQPDDPGHDSRLGA